MTDYPNREHQNADEAARRRALAVLDHLVNEVAIMRRRIENDRVDGDDGRQIASLARDLTQHVSVLGVLRDVREWHEADQSGAESVSQAGAAGDAQPYSGPRYCLFCGSRARWDVSGFLSCSSSVHLGRARDALAARREQEDAAEEGVAAELRQSDAS